MLDGDGQFLYDRVATLVAGMIDAGTLRCGERAPSLRGLSGQLGVSLSTVMQAYSALEARGYLEAKPQSGFYVRARRLGEMELPTPARSRGEPREVRVGEVLYDILAEAQDPQVIPLAVAIPDASLLPGKALNRCLARVAARSSEASLEYSMPPGVPALRRQIALRATPLAGRELSAADVVITTGATEALAVSLSAVTRAGDVVAVETPVYYLLLQLLQRMGLKALEIGTDPEHGMDLGALERKLDQAQVKAVLSVPNFHNPTGSRMPAARKARLVEMLRARNLPLIEDDIYGDLQFADERPELARRFDRSGLVLTCSSFSKTLAPGYRVGWVLPGRFRSQVIHAKQVMTSATASAPQLAVAEFLEAGGYDRHLRRIRRAYSGQLEQMRGAIAAHFPAGTRVSRPRGGFVLWVELPPGRDSVLLYQRARAVDISIMPGTLFSNGDRYRSFLRLSAGHTWDQRTEQAIATLGTLAEELPSA